MSDSATPRTVARHASLSITNSQSLLKLTSIESVMPSNHLILCCPLLLLPSIFPSTRVFSNESALRIRWPKCWNFSFSISPSNEYPGLVSFRMAWLDLLAVQGTLTLPSPLPMSISLFFMSASPVLPCKKILQYHFSRFHMCALEYDIYLSLSDSPHSV